MKDKIGVSVLTWDRLCDTKILFHSLVEEIELCKEQFDIKIYVCDNGSTDETKEYLYSLKNIHFLNINKKNEGISNAKNILIEKNIEDKNTYMFMFDNDQSIIPGSFIEMVSFMKENKNVGCFAHNANFYSKDINDCKILKNFPKLNELNISYNNKSGVGATRAWCSYSVFLVNIFEDGIKFETKGPFGIAGYGFDDDDLGMQIKKAGYDIACFNNIYCYHSISSSVDSLKKNNQFNYNERKEFFLKKWNI